MASSLIVFSGIFGPLGCVFICEQGRLPGIKPEIALIAFSPAFLKNPRMSLILRCCLDATAKDIKKKNKIVSLRMSNKILNDKMITTCS